MKHPTYDDMPYVLQDYLKNYLSVTKNRSKNTVNEYYYDLRDIFQYIKRDKYNMKIDNYKEIDISDLDYVLSIPETVSYSYGLILGSSFTDTNSYIRFAVAYNDSLEKRLGNSNITPEAASVQLVKKIETLYN